MGEARASETGHVTGTADKDYDLIWYIESCLNNALRLETYLEDAQRANDTELVQLFGKAQADSRKGAEMGKRLLGPRLTDRMRSPSADPMAPGGIPGGAPHGDPLASAGPGTRAK